MRTIDAPDALRGWIADTLRDGLASPDLGGFAPDALIERAEWEGVLPLLEWRLRGGEGYMALPERFRNALAARARHYAADALLRRHTLDRVAQALSDAGLRVLLLKGPAFALWLYPQPYLRVSGDIDLLFASREEADRAARAVVPLGYALAFSPSSMTYEMTSRYAGDGVHNLELDLHCRLVNVPAYAGKFGFEELWAESLALPGLDPTLRGLAPLQALAHACIHRAVDLMLQSPEKLKWIYDIHLMLERLDESGWARLLELLRAKGLAGVCLRSIEDSVGCFATPVPADALSRMRRIAAEEPLDYRRLDDWRYMQWQSFKALPDAGKRFRWLWERVVPTRSYLREFHGEGSWLQLMLRRMGRAVVRLRQLPDKN